MQTPGAPLTPADVPVNHLPYTTLQLIAVCLGLSPGPAILVGQSSKVDLKAEEAAIRALIAKAGTNPPYTDDHVFWSGAIKRPKVGSQPIDPFPEAKVDKRKNEKATYKVERL
jgi:hypothetical protein